MIVAVIPVKELTRSKQRLQPPLTAEERYLFSTAMLEDVLAASVASPVFDRVLVITSDLTAATLARRLGAGVITEARQLRQSRSVEAAAAVCRRMGADAMLTLPLDVPLVTTDDLAVLVEKGTATQGIVLAPSRDRLGTNALLVRPPDAIPFRFGFDSFDAHRNVAAARGLPCEVCDLPNLALDIDEVEDLRSFLATAARTRARELLHQLRIDERLGVETPS
jgi:2-phospho-L-lactate guanylyltransferase